MSWKPVLIRGRHSDPGAQGRHRAAQSHRSARVSLLIWKPCLLSPPGIIAGLSSVWFYFQGYIILIGIAFRMIFTNLCCKAPLLSRATQKIQRPPYAQRVGVTYPGLRTKSQEDETRSLGLAVFSPRKLWRVSEIHLVDLNK